MVSNCYSACRDTYIYPFFECDNIYEARQILRLYNSINYQEDYGPIKSKDEDNYYENEGDMAEVIVIDNLYLEREIEVIIDPYKGLGPFNEIEVYEIDMDVLNRLKIED